MATSQRSLGSPTPLRETFPTTTGNSGSVTSDDPSNLQQSGGPEESRNSFTLRGLFAGLTIGVLICFCNTYFGLQTGWGSGMSMPSSLMGFAFFKLIAKHLQTPFQPVENVFVQTVAGAVGTMSLGCGFVGFIPAMEFLLKPSEGAPIELGIGRLVTWSLGICFFGSVFTVILRKQVILREKLRFPSGTATALLIGVLHGKVINTQHHVESKASDTDESRGLQRGSDYERSSITETGRQERSDASESERAFRSQDSVTAHDNLQDDVRDRYIQLLIKAFSLSAIYTIFSYFVPQIHSVPILGTTLAKEWLWTLNPSPAYFGQGIILGPATSLHVLLGAIIGWGVLSPLTRNNGWAPGPIDDWETGSKGWIMWISLSIMLADSLTNLGWLVLRPILKNCSELLIIMKECVARVRKWGDLVLRPSKYQHYDPLSQLARDASVSKRDADELSQNLISNRAISIMLPFSLALCVLCTQLSFGSFIPLGLSILATILSLIATVMGVRALGETDINPASGIAKLVQLAFTFFTDKANPNAVVINCVAGTIAESGAGQGGDMMQDLKTGHLLDASPKAQFYGQVIGSVFGVVVSSVVYRLYVSVYDLPNSLFQIPAAYLWISTARLVTGKGLPPMVWQFGSRVGLIFVTITVLRIYLGNHGSPQVRTLQRFVPGGVAVAVGMYTTPSFSITRAIGGVLGWWYTYHFGTENTIIVVASSGLILGEGIVSMVNLALASLNVPHF